MRIAQERVHLEHDVTLFAGGDSTTAATLEAVCPQALRSHALRSS